ncbi:MAG: LytTR family DNA-binding domain-containing protein [Chitinophagales bacterium]|nr:LytTR family DNA-binding domain-containing protein [Chitinophagales bacterium]
MKAIIIEDEKNIRQGLIKMLAVFCPDVDVIEEAGSVQEAIRLSTLNACDLVFLDIELPDGSGFDFLRKTLNRQFQIIFVTAYNQYAIDAFRLSAADYLLKPINPEHLIEAVKKAALLSAKTINDTSLSLLLHNSFEKEKKILLKDVDNIYIIKIKDILHCKADGGYTHFYMIDGQEIITSFNLKEYEKALSRWGFIRCHHSHLVNFNHILRFSRTDGGTLILTNEIEIPVSHRKKEHLLQTIQALSRA